MRSLISHLRHAIRLLLKSPGFTITAILILGLGIGANTAIFSLINGVLLKPLPNPRADRLVQIYQPTQDSDTMSVAYSDYVDFRAGQHTLQDLTLIYRDDLQIIGNGDPERVEGAYVTGNFFPILGRPFLLGRPFGDKEEAASANVAVLSDRFWNARFHSDPKVIGSSINLNGRVFQIVGISPEQVNGSRQSGVYLPFSVGPRYVDVKSRRSGHMFSCIGRLKDGVTLQQAQTDFEVITRNLQATYPATSAGFGVKLVPLLDSVVGNFSATLWLLGGAVVCLLIITCANTANLLLARARERTKEMMVRAALGASQKRLLAQLLSESLVLAILGGAVGLVTSCWAVSAIKWLDPGKINRLQTITVDGSSLLFALCVTLVTAVLFGLLPALVISRANLASALRDEGGRTGTAGRERQRSQDILVIGQVALASVLLFGAGLLLRSFLALQNAPLGFNSHHVLLADINLVNKKYAEDGKRKTFFDQLLGQVRHLPGVVEAGLNTGLPFRWGDYESLCIAGQPVTDVGRLPWMEHDVVSPGYFRTLGIPLLRGRLFDDHDQEGAENVVIINNAIAQRYFPGQDPIGKQLDDLGSFFGKRRHLTKIVGVVSDVQHGDPETQETPFQSYFPYMQTAGAFGEIAEGGILVVRTNGNPESIVGALRKTIAAIDPDLPLANVGAYDDLISNSFTPKRISVVVVSFFSGVALLLAAIGLYAVLSYSVSLRIREIGVRMALGAAPKNILQLVTRQGLRIVGAGLIAGLAAGITLAHLVGSILYGVSATDPVALATSVLVLGLAALLACLLPAFRATRIDPITALRD
jgi:putative ABC transport system permease protein